jgi:hypothetical protein
LLPATEPPPQPKSLILSKPRNKAARSSRKFFRNDRWKTSPTRAGFKIRDENRKRAEIPVRFEIVSNETNSPDWSSAYETAGTSSRFRLTVVHCRQSRRLFSGGQQFTNEPGQQPNHDPLRRLDFWIADLGLNSSIGPIKDFEIELRKTRLCRVLKARTHIRARPYSRSFFQD